MLLDHTIVGQTATTLEFNKERAFAGCRICGAVFQPHVNTLAVSDEEYARNPLLRIEAEAEIRLWRDRHNERHSAREHLALAESGLTLTPEAAHKMAPFGLVPVADAENDEIADALRSAPRAPVDDVDTTLKGVY